MAYLQLILDPGGSLQQANALLHREVTHGTIESAVSKQASKGLLALWAAAVVVQLSPLKNALGCRPHPCVRYGFLDIFTASVAVKLYFICGK